MPDYKEVTQAIQVPENTGLEGFMRTLRTILKLPRVQEVRIDSRGQVSFRRFVADSEEEEAKANNFGVDFDTLQPYYIVRNSKVQEFIPPPNLSAAVVLGLMFDKVAKDRLTPLSFVTGKTSALWDWYRYTTGHQLEDRETLFGLPLRTDRHLPDTVLLLCAGFGRDASFIDTQASYKVEMPVYELPTTEVQVMP